MAVFEFGDYTLELAIAGEQFTVNCVAELAETMQWHQEALVTLAGEISGGAKTSSDAVGLCKEILDDILGEGAFGRIFAERAPTLTDCTDVLRFVLGEIGEKARATQTGA